MEPGQHEVKRARIVIEMEVRLGPREVPSDVDEAYWRAHRPGLHDFFDEAYLRLHRAGLNEWVRPLEWPEHLPVVRPDVPFEGVNVTSVTFTEVK